MKHGDAEYELALRDAHRSMCFLSRGLLASEAELTRLRERVTELESAALEPQKYKDFAVERLTKERDKLRARVHQLETGSCEVTCVENQKLRAELSRITKAHDGIAKAYEEAQVSMDAMEQRVREKDAEIERLSAEVKRWEDEEIGKAVCCMENENAAKEARAALDVAVAALRKPHTCPGFVECHICQAAHAPTITARLAYLEKVEGVVEAARRTIELSKVPEDCGFYATLPPLNDALAKLAALEEVATAPTTPKSPQGDEKE